MENGQKRIDEITSSRTALGNHIGGAEFCGVRAFDSVVVVTKTGTISDGIELDVTIDGATGTIGLRNFPAAWQKIEDWYGEGTLVTTEHRDWDDSVLKQSYWIDSEIRNWRIKRREIKAA